MARSSVFKMTSVLVLSSLLVISSERLSAVDPELRDSSPSSVGSMNLTRFEPLTMGASFSCDERNDAFSVSFSVASASICSDFLGSFS